MTDFEQLVSYYEENRHLEWEKWLEVVEIFKNPGKQGLVGLMKSKKSNHLFVFKISQYLNYLAQHELTIMHSLNDLDSYCPYFCKSVGGILCNVDPERRKSGNPFESGTNVPKVEKEVMLMEYIPKSTKFYNYIRSEHVHENVLYSAVKQVLLAVHIAQRDKNFTHYDLHSNNIMMRKCSKNLVVLFILDENTQYCVSTFGHFPTIIDFGFSYVREMDEQYLWPSLGHTEVGFMSTNFDHIADPKLFLVTISDEINRKKSTKNSKILKNITRNIYRRLNIDWDCGWDKDVEDSVAETVLNVLDKYSKISPLFKEHGHYCLDIIQTLIPLPLEKQDYSDIKIVFTTFLTEFVKIEKEIGTSFYCIYILKCMVDFAREVCADYQHEETREKALYYFRTSLISKIETIAKFCKLKDLHFEKLLCSLLCMARRLEGLFHVHIEKRMSEKLESYKKIKLQTPAEVYEVIDYNIEDEYVFNENTKILVLDSVKKSKEIVKITDLKNYEKIITNLNSTKSIFRGNILYKNFKKFKKLDF